MNEKELIFKAIVIGLKKRGIIAIVSTYTYNNIETVRLLINPVGDPKFKDKLVTTLKDDGTLSWCEFKEHIASPTFLDNFAKAIAICSYHACKCQCGECPLDSIHYEKTR